ncbi:MAG: undecaprenyl-diphosphate phosphatase [Gammaproteobacteria bacterium]|nr:MAG: undecaprenyl-diphosphate phosphatase [Gammaproteobacteria bacterium]
MGTLQAFLLALVQGLTEFLPISSSAHLVLLPVVMEWQDQGLVMDIAAHLGSLFAVLFYFRHDLNKLSKGWLQSFSTNNSSNEDARLAWLVLWATLPIFIVALLVQAYLIPHMRNAVVIGVASIVFGLLLWHADKSGKQTRHNYDLTMRDALLVGIAQVFALIPGASRSGVTMTAGMWLGLTRVEAARFSFLLAIPTILAASLYGGYRSLQHDVVINWGLTLGVVVCSAIVAFLCIHWFIKFVSQIGMLPFVIYRVALGGLLLFFYL